VIGFDAWLYTPDQIDALERGLAGSGVTLRPCENIIDRVWPDRPAPPQGLLRPYPEGLAGESHGQKRARLAEGLRSKGQTAAVLTKPDSIAWLLNIRGSDIPRNPVPHAFAILHDSSHLSLYADPAKLTDEVRAHLGEEVTARPLNAFLPALRSLSGPVRLDRSSAPLRLVQELEEAGVITAWGEDPCLLPKARKTQAEIAATREAHLRDGAAVCEFLAWFYAQAPGTITEIDVVTRLESCRHDTGKLLDISFDTVAGSGPNGALAHYNVSQASNRTLQAGDLMVLDSGGQYLDGTTDITRTLPVGQPGEEERTAYTRVLQGMIAMSRVRWPKGLAGRDLDVLARYPLWLADQDYGHGTGHGVGVHLCVHEGPQKLSRASDVPLDPGMIVSNEPGFYREGAFGIRIENLVVVREAEPLSTGDATGKLDFETITFAPIDTGLIVTEMLSTGERDWLNAYHMACREKLMPALSVEAAAWLSRATEPI
jgi:Xaa-Pro aminopeptidase